MKDKDKENKKKIVCRPRRTEEDPYEGKESRFEYFFNYWIYMHWKGTVLCETLFALVVGLFLEVVPIGKDIVQIIRSGGFAIFAFYAIGMLAFFIHLLDPNRDDPNMRHGSATIHHLSLFIQILVFFTAIYLLIFK